VLVVGQREQEIQTAGLGAGEDAPRKKDAEGLPGIDDGGDAQLLSALAPADVPSDGRPYRVPVFRFESEAEAEQVCFPEKALAVFLRSEQTNRAERPILAGPVDLIREHGLVGRTSVLFIAPGEKFHLSWGPEHALRVWRESHEKEPEDTLLNAIKTWATLERRVELRLSNLGGQPCRVKVQERMPVSEIAQVVIEPDAERTTQGARPDANGFVSWDADLPPHGRKELTLRYRLKKRKDVVGV
jgi:uncharacterized protein (TIGR02231 family)